MYSTTPWSPWSPIEAAAPSARPARQPARRIGYSHPIRHPNSPTRAIPLKGCSLQKPMPLVKTVVKKIQVTKQEFEQLVRTKLTAHKKKKQIMPAESPRALPTRSGLGIRLVKPRVERFSSRMPPLFNRNVFEDTYIPTRTLRHTCEYKFCCEDGVQKECSFCGGVHEDHHCGTVLEQDKRELLLVAYDICRVCGKKVSNPSNGHHCNRKKCIYCPLYCHVPSLCRSALYQGMLMMIENYKIACPMENKEEKKVEMEKILMEGEKNEEETGNENT